MDHDLTIYGLLDLIKFCTIHYGVIITDSPFNLPVQDHGEARSTSCVQCGEDCLPIGAQL